MIPDFSLNGNLPPGIHFATWQEVLIRFGWNSHRLRLLQGLERALTDLQQAGCLTVYVDGSFVTSTEVPRDFDACWDSTGANPRLLDRALITFDPGRATQKAKYYGELFRADSPASASRAPFLRFFQQDRSGQAKGIVALDLRSWP